MLGWLNWLSSPKSMILRALDRSCFTHWKRSSTSRWLSVLAGYHGARRSTHVFDVDAGESATTFGMSPLILRTQ